MFFLIPLRIITMIYLLAALLPGFFLLRYIYSKDHMEKENPLLLGSLLLQGVWAAFVSIIFEWVGESILDVSLSQESPYYVLILAFLVVGAVEEGTKFFFLKRKTWNIPDFNYTFDGIVYAVFVSMGFALFENIKYVFGYGLPVAFSRAFLAVPAHMGFAVFMGYFFSRAKRAENRGNRIGSVCNQIAAYVIAVLLHGFYDSTAMKGTSLSTLLFIVFVVAMYLIVINLVKKESKKDSCIY
ncbi:MAG: PrsW family glutamic-type intramembrane protease [Sphaerochaetaceae bacterium]